MTSATDPALPAGDTDISGLPSGEDGASGVSGWRAPHRTHNWSRQAPVALFQYDTQHGV